MKISEVVGSRLLPVVAVIFILVIIAVSSIAISFGRSYQRDINTVSTPKKAADAQLGKKRNVKRVTIRKNGENQCIEVTPDGIVRIFATCGGDSTASRPTDSKYILELLKLATEIDPNKVSPGTGDYYELIVETDTGSQTIRVYQNGGGSGVVDTIVNVINNLPSASASPNVSPPLVIPTPFVTPEPTPPVVPTPSPGASDIPFPTEQPFNCNYAPTPSGGIPYRVSNIVCTDTPQSP